MGGDAAMLAGVLQVTDKCVVLETGNDSTVMLVWPSDQTRWDPRLRMITFQNADSEVRELRGGQAVSFGGSGRPVNPRRSGDPASIEGTSWDAFIASMEWEAQPDPTCDVEGSWSVGEVIPDD